LDSTSQSGGIGRRARLKIVYLRMCGFDSRLWYESRLSRLLFSFCPMASAYILYSIKLDRFYTGSCREFQFRFEDHLGKVYPGAFTSNSDDWQLFLLVENLTYTQARAIENHIKKMKSRQYIQNLVKFPRILARLKAKYV
jgi:putative endonuclease